MFLLNQNLSFSFETSESQIKFLRRQILRGNNHVFRVFDKLSRVDKLLAFYLPFSSSVRHWVLSIKDHRPCGIQLHFNLIGLQRIKT